MSSEGGGAAEIGAALGESPTAAALADEDDLGLRGGVGDTTTTTNARATASSQPNKNKQQLDGNMYATITSLAHQELQSFATACSS